MTTFEIVLVIALLVTTPMAILCGWFFGRAFQAGVDRTMRSIEGTESLISQGARKTAHRFDLGGE